PGCSSGRGHSAHRQATGGDTLALWVERGGRLLSYAGGDGQADGYEVARVAGNLTASGHRSLAGGACFGVWVCRGAGGCLMASQTHVQDVGAALSRPWKKHHVGGHRGGRWPAGGGPISGPCRSGLNGRPWLSSCRMKAV